MARKTAKPSIRSKICTVTPTMARAWLAKNFRNRPVMATAIAQYAADMKKDHWFVSEAAICFSDTERLLNGQHRLLACIAAEKPFRTCVITGLSEEAFRYMDRGKTRSNAAIASMAGTKNATTVSAIAAAYFRYQRKCPMTGGFVTPTSEDILELLELHPGFQDSFRKVQALKPLVTPSIMGFVHYVAASGDPKKADEFVNGIIAAFNMEGTFAPNDPRKMLVRHLMQTSGRYMKMPKLHEDSGVLVVRKGACRTSNAGANRAYIINRVIVAWNHFCLPESKWPKLCRVPDETFIEVSGANVEMVENPAMEREMFATALRIRKSFETGKL